MDDVRGQGHKLDGMWGDDFNVYRSSRRWENETENLETRDYAFNRHSMNLVEGGHDNVSPFDNGVVSVGTDNIEVRLIQGVPDTFVNVLAKTTRATIGVEPGAEEDDERDAEEMLRGGLQTALEDAVVVFEVRGASRTCTHQLVRTRKAAFHQQSQRASFMGEVPEVRMPESIWRNEEARRAFLSALAESHRAYRIAAEEDIAYQDARFILPEGTNNYILLEYPLRTFIDTYNYRGCFMFQWEIGHVMREARRVLVEAHPWLEPHIKISCERTSGPEEFGGHKCTFQGWESVNGQCPFEWADDDNRTYKPREDLLIKRKEAQLPLAPWAPEGPAPEEATQEPLGALRCAACEEVASYLWTRPTGSQFLRCASCGHTEER